MAVIAVLGAAETDVPRWAVFEAAFTAAAPAVDPLATRFRVTFRSPSGTAHTVDGFWDGGTTWRVRYSPAEVGGWTYSTAAEPGDAGLHGRTGAFRVTAAQGRTRFDRNGPVRVSRSRTFLEHEDGTPFFWLADTGWNAALLSTPEEWRTYLAERTRQRFTAIQWVATQWRAAPDGDRLGEAAFTGTDRIAVNHAFFQRLDAKAAELNRAGLLNVPVLLWAIGGGSNPAVNPGFSLPEDQAIRLARYMVARWQAYDVVWILPGDGDYRGERAEKWKRIGRAVFGDAPHAPVLLHPGGMHWVLDEFRQEPWLDIHGYQSGHGDDDKTLRWMIDGPPAKDWRGEPLRPFINLEPPYENHVAYQSGQPISPHAVRRAVYWSLLNAPTAGVTYGGHGVWGWDDGTKPPTDHAKSGIPLPWRKALRMPGAEQMAHVAALFTSIDFWRLRPAPEVLAEQPGATAVSKFVTAAAYPGNDVIVLYTPEPGSLTLKAEAVPEDLEASWFDPRTGRRTRATGTKERGGVRFDTPGQGDWALLLQVAVYKPTHLERETTND
ncbi:MAG TPA: DUF4038 domain-containing protein [Vicinamibacterales bacterium]|nr:DUF4038 domain-containing protein [Vicinamibacterales bacterium]